MISLIFVVALVGAVKIPFSGPLIPDDGMHVAFSNVQKITVEKSSNPYSQNFKKPYFAFEFEIKGKKIKEGDFYAIIEKTDDFHISCERYKSMGTVTAKKGKLTIKGKKSIKESGFYSMYICKSIDNNKEYFANGWVSAKSVHGFIEPGNFGEIQFEAYLSIGYFFFCLGWLYLMSKWSDSVMFIHKVLTVLLVSTLFNEVISWYVLDYENKTGEHEQIAVIAQLFSAFHGTLVRYVGLMIAFGWGLATNQVPQKAYFQVFSMVYFVMTMATDTKTNLNTHSQNYFNIFSTAFSCVYDATWGSLIMKGLDDIQVSLKESSQTLKAELYKTLKKITDIALSIAVVFCIMSFGYMESDYRFNYYSAYWWFCHSCWTFEFAVLLALACYFFRPQRGSRNMAEGVQIGAGEDSDEENFAASDGLGNFAAPPSADLAEPTAPKQQGEFNPLVPAP